MKGIGTGHWGLGIRVKTGVIGSLMASVTGGCQFNTSSLHGDLTPEEMSNRVRQRVHAGERGEDVKAKLISADLSPHAANVDLRDLNVHARGLEAVIDPPGLNFAQKYVSGYLYLWFSPDDRLVGAAYQQFTVDTKPRTRTYSIPLDEAKP